MNRSQTEITAAEEQALTTFMQQLRAAPADASMRVTGPDILWLKAQLIQRWDAQRRVQMPIDVMEPFEIAASLVAAMLLLAWSVPSAFEWLPRLF